MLTFRLYHLFYLSFVIAALITWFSSCDIELSKFKISNDHMYWSSFERLTSNEEYADWDKRIPDGARWATGSDANAMPPTLFSVNDWVVAPLPPSVSNYDSYSSRGFGLLVVIHGTKYNSGSYAQEIEIPKNAVLLFQPWLLVLLVDGVFVCTILFLPLILFALSKRFKKRQ